MPNDIVDLIGLEDNSQVILTLEEKNDRHLLVYSVLKSKALDPGLEPETYPLHVPMQQSANLRRTAGKP